MQKVFHLLLQTEERKEESQLASQPLSFQPPLAQYLHWKAPFSPPLPSSPLRLLGLHICTALPPGSASPRSSSSSLLSASRKKSLIPCLLFSVFIFFFILKGQRNVCYRMQGDVKMKRKKMAPPRIISSLHRNCGLSHLLLSSVLVPRILLVLSSQSLRHLRLERKRGREGEAGGKRLNDLTSYRGGGGERLLLLPLNGGGRPGEAARCEQGERGSGSISLGERRRPKRQGGKGGREGERGDPPPPRKKVGEKASIHHTGEAGVAKKRRRRLEAEAGDRGM